MTVTEIQRKASELERQVWLRNAVEYIVVLILVLRRPLAQVGLGIVAGGILVALTLVGLYQSAPTGAEAALIAAYSLLMMGVCLLACIVPTRRALRVEPADVLRFEV